MAIACLRHIEFDPAGKIFLCAKSVNSLFNPILKQLLIFQVLRFDRNVQSL